jgi:hypothetical protein
MYIAKPFRILTQGVIIGAGVGLTFALLHRRIGTWAVIPALIAFPLFGFVGGFIVDAFDFWLRRVMRDPHGEAWSEHQADLDSRRESLGCRMEAARQKAIHLGLAGPADVDRFIHDLPTEDFRKHFGEFRVSRVFFKKAD